jgi:hypothetical protein
LLPIIHLPRWKLSSAPAQYITETWHAISRCALRERKCQKNSVVHLGSLPGVQKTGDFVRGAFLLILLCGIVQTFRR